MDRYVLWFREIDQTQADLVGSKGAHLAELSRIEGIRVPAGFCVTTTAFQRFTAHIPSIDDTLIRLSHVTPDDGDAIRTLSRQLRGVLEGTAIPDDMAMSLVQSLADLGEQVPCAVRSSATTEDSPTDSFAGQLDSYLNVVGPAAILEHVRRCWASFFTERAVTYRLRKRIDHRNVHMAVVVQRMVFPDVAGILFTADPVTGHRKVASIEASFGLGEALVSGQVNPDVYRVRDGAIIARTIAVKRLAVSASPLGGTQQHAIDGERQEQPALTDAQVARLVVLGRRIEAHFGRPQDIEWCLVGDDFHFVQSRPITTLFPIPDAGDEVTRIYVSVGHNQMMTDPLKPLGLSFWQMTTPRPMAEAGGRLFVDVTQSLASPAGRAALLGVFGRSDPLIRDALQTVIDRDDGLRMLPDEAVTGPWAGSTAAATAPIETAPAIVADLIERSQASIAALKRDIQGKSGTALLDFILEDIQELKRILFDPGSMQVIMAGMESNWWLSDQLQAWLGDKNAVDTLTQSVPGNVTSEMGLALLDVADVIRPYPDVVALLRRARDGDVLEALPNVAGGREARNAIRSWLERYGMRGAGEIDITRPRWSERPVMLVPLLLGHIENFEPGAAARRFEQGKAEAEKKEQDVLDRLRSLPNGQEKADETKRHIDRLRAFAGYREYPKYGMVSRYAVYKQALMVDAERLVQTGILRARDDIFYLRFEELQAVVRTNEVDHQLIQQRKDAFQSYQALTPPRVLTSDGEMIAGSYRRDDFPAGALVGLPVSAGTVEGRARVILDMATADLDPGDILVTAYTDPSWTPLFVAIKGLVTEVGGLMTHGAVIAREYGLPAVVGVERATRLIPDGQRIRVHGTDGYVEILPGS